MRMNSVMSRLLLIMMVFGLAACGGTFRTHYDAPVDSAGWRVTAVDVSVPRTLVVSEEEVFIPQADIVWREDPAGDRYNQVAAIMKDAVSRGSAGLKGPRAVRLEVTVTRFHALTFLAEAQAPAGVHNVHFNIVAKDARTGEVLAGPEAIEAALPAMTGVRMAQARARGETQKSQITAHVAKTIAAWLGISADARQTFASVGA